MIKIQTDIHIIKTEYIDWDDFCGARNVQEIMKQIEEMEHEYIRSKITNMATVIIECREIK